MQYYFKRSFVLLSSEVILSFLIKMSRQKAIEIETTFFHSLGNPKGRTLDHFFFASHIRYNFSYELVEIFLKLSMKTVQVYLIIRGGYRYGTRTRTFIFYGYGNLLRMRIS